MPLNLLGVNSSLRPGSDGLKALDLVLSTAKNLGATTQLLDLRVIELPLYHSAAAENSEAVAEAHRLAQWADIFVLSTPDYHGSMSGAMKNFLDYHWSEFAGKLFGYLCTSHERGLTAMDQMRTAIRQCYGWSLPYGCAIHAHLDFSPEGQITNPKLAHRLQMMGHDLVSYGTLLRRQFQSDLANPASNSFAARYRDKT